MPKPKKPIHTTSPSVDTSGVGSESPQLKRREPPAAMEADLKRLVHSLEVHQIELEMQNNELRQSRAERELALTRYTELYDFAPVGYLTLSSAGLISAINLTGATLLGDERSALLQRRLVAFVAPADQSRWAEFLLKVQTSDAQEAIELLMQRGDGTIFNAQLDCVRYAVTRTGAFASAPADILSADAPPAANEAIETPRQVSIALTDITARKAVELKLNQAMLIAEKADNAKTEFLSRMSHELRTPLNSILGFAQLLEAGSPPPTESQQNRLNQIMKGGWYLLELINEILDLASIESEQVTLTHVPVSLAEVFWECRAMVEPQAQIRGISLEFPALERRCFVLADRTRLKQVMINLLSNAVKYNSARGKVIVSYALRPSNSIRINIEDTGVGLSSEQLTNLFQPFNRLGRELGGEQGTGIGLVITKRLVNLMGATMGVESTVGVGSVFWVEIALTSAPELGVSASQSSADGIAPHGGTQ